MVIGMSGYRIIGELLSECEVLVRKTFHKVCLNDKNGIILIKDVLAYGNLHVLLLNVWLFHIALFR